MEGIRGLGLGSSIIVNINVQSAPIEVVLT